MQYFLKNVSKNPLFQGRSRDYLIFIWFWSEKNFARTGNWTRSTWVAIYDTDH